MARGQGFLCAGQAVGASTLASTEEGGRGERRGAGHGEAASQQTTSKGLVDGKENITPVDILLGIMHTALVRGGGGGGDTTGTRAIRKELTCRPLEQYFVLLATE